MPSYRSPGVYVEEISRPWRPIARPSCSTAGFVGFTQRGPADPASDPDGWQPRRVSSWSEFEADYGGLTDEALLPWAVRGFFDNGGTSCYIARVPATSSAETFIGSAELPQGLHALEGIHDVSIVMIPDLHTAARQAGDAGDALWTDVQRALVEHCEQAGDRMAILDTPPGLDPNRAESWRTAAGFDSADAALYYPWVTVEGPGSLGEPTTIRCTVPPCGHVAGIWARTETTRGVWKAPANEVVSGVVDLEHRTTTLEQEPLNAVGVNVIRERGGRDVRVWGARTLAPAVPDRRYIGVRRLGSMIQRAIADSTGSVVFEPNDEGTWSAVRHRLDGFLLGLWRDGALCGNSPDEAFFVKCDATTNTPASIDAGLLTFEFGFSALVPSEFVVVRHEQPLSS
ncbi:MAG: phage tail sheath subtilisin-like domain-containing protein [Ilumatobacteraceae bacterium]